MDESTLDKVAEFICGNGEQYPEYRSSSRLTAFLPGLGFLILFTMVLPDKNGCWNVSKLAVARSWHLC